MVGGECFDNPVGARPGKTGAICRVGACDSFVAVVYSAPNHCLDTYCFILEVRVPENLYMMAGLAFASIYFLYASYAGAQASYGRR